MGLCQILNHSDSSSIVISWAYLGFAPGSGSLQRILTKFYTPWWIHTLISLVSSVFLSYSLFLSVVFMEVAWSYY